jgi:hypothetical protein
VRQCKCIDLLARLWHIRCISNIRSSRVIRDFIDTRIIRDSRGTRDIRVIMDFRVFRARGITDFWMIRVIIGYQGY